MRVEYRTYMTVFSERYRPLGGQYKSKVLRSARCGSRQLSPFPRSRGPAACAVLVLAVFIGVAGPLAVPANAAATIVEDTSIGTGINQVSYAGRWTQCGGCSPRSPNNSFRYSNSYGSIATVAFTGSHIAVYGIKERHGGFAAFTIDDGTPTIVDTFAVTSVVSPLYSSGQLTAGTHTLRITNTYQRNAASDGYSVGFDRAEVTSVPTPPPPPVPTALTIEDSAVGTGDNQIFYAGNWLACGGCIPRSPDNSFRYTSGSGAVATIRFTGAQINLYGLKERHGGFSTVRLDGGPPVSIDGYAPTSSMTLLYSSEKIAYGKHTVTITNIGQHNTASDGYVVGFDRAEVTVGAAPPPAPPSHAGPRSGLGWLSGVNGDPAMTPANVDAFCDWRGTPCDFALLYASRYSWSAVSQPTELLTSFATWPGRLTISIPPFPENVGGSNATCATGAYDSYWRNFGQTLNNFGRQSSFIRLAWEGNGDWFPWSGTNPTDYINCWRHVADAINATAEPDPTLCWSVNAHYSQNPPSHNALDLYPGDAHVDGVGFDAYDHFPPSRTKEEFDAQANAVGGINYMWNFARAHNKLFGVGEWGVVSGSGANGGGDNANYIQWMYDWFQAHQGKGLAYEFYFTNCEQENVGSNIFRPIGPNCFWLNHEAARRYRDLF